MTHATWTPMMSESIKIGILWGEVTMRRLTGLSVCVLLYSLVHSAAAFDFDNIVDTQGTFSGYQFTSIEPFPGLNDAGQLVFVATTTGGSHGVFLADVATGAVAQVIDDSGSYDQFDATFLNQAGLIAVAATRDDGERELLTVTPTGVATGLVDSTGLLDNWQIPADINHDGVVVFQAYLDAGGRAVMTANGSTPLNTTVTVDAAYDTYFLPLINDAGEVAFFGTTAGAGALIVEDSAGAQTVVTGTDSSAGPLSGAIPFDLNDHGDVVFLATELVSSEKSLQLFRADSGTTETIVSAALGFPLTGIVDPNINNAGQIVFDLGPVDTCPYLLTLSGPVPLISPGDPLLGSTLTSAGVGRSLNNLGQVAMAYSLQDGTFGIAVTTVPEPAGLLLSAILCTALGLRRRLPVRSRRTQGTDAG